jgi:alcohol dehydrogenase
MLQLVYVGPGRLEWREAPEPSLDSDAAALVRPVAVATCDLDALIVAGRSPFAPPFALGHEGVAEVLDVGDDVEGISPGDLVTVPFQISCGSCAACRQGRTGNCREVDFMSTYGFGPAVERWGGFLADVVAVPYAEHMLVPFPSGLEPAALASASDNLSDAWRTVAPALAHERGAPVLVVGGAGAGSIGLYAVALALALGAQSVTYVDADPGRRNTAAGLGAEVVAELPRRLGPYPITVDSSADADGLRLALRSTAPDGTCTSTGIYFERQELPLLEMYSKGITFHTGRGHVRRAIPEVLGLAASGALHPEAVTSRIVAWQDAPAALLAGDWTKLVIER